MTMMKGILMPLLMMSFVALSGCFGSSSVKSELTICEILDDEDDWIQPAVMVEKKYGTPLSLTFALLEQPLTELDKKHVKVRTADWDEYRIRTEQWDASPYNVNHAVDFIGWFTQESVKRNQISMNDVSAHYLSLRLGHGNYHRLDPNKYPELVQQAEQVERRALRWQDELKACKNKWRSESWFKALKFW